MTFGKLKRALTAIINRKDLSDELAGDLINRGIADIERELRIGPMERVVETPEFDGGANSILIPTGYLELIDLFSDDRQLIQKDKAALFNRQYVDGPEVFSKVADRWLIAPAPPAGSKLYLHYFSESPELVSDEDENVWTKAGFNAALYAAAVLATDIFQMEDEVTARWTSKVAGYVRAISDQDNREVWSGPLNIERPKQAGEY